MSNPNLTPDNPASNRLTWDETIAYFRARRAVLFYSSCRFWEEHAFVQQSLAKCLTENGIHVYWRDGDSWRPEAPHLGWNSNHLEVVSGRCLPGRGLFPWVVTIDAHRFRSEVRKQLGRFPDPVIWVQGGLREELACQLPYIDVFSAFDDPFYFSDESTLKSRARVRTAQNSYTWEMHFSGKHSGKTVFPPVELPASTGQAPSPFLPSGFPKKVMGYIGSFFDEDYDLELFEYMVRNLPDWGFVLAGRTNGAGEEKLRRLVRYPNFHRIAWMPREQIVSLWKSLKVCLLLHRPRRTQYGAFPTKILEATYYGVPCAGTDVPKTKDIAGVFPMTSFATELRKRAVEVSFMGKEKIAKIHEDLFSRMDPRAHLVEIATQLADRETSSRVKAVA